MQINTSFLQTIPLFSGIKAEDFKALFACVGAKEESYDKGEFIFLNGNMINSIGIVISGRVQIIKEDIFGNKAILNDLMPKAVFGESFVCGGNYALTVSVQAVEKSTVIFLPFDRVMHICPSACGFHNSMIKNMVEMIAQKT